MATVIDRSGNSPANGVEPHIPTPSERKTTLADGVTAPAPIVGYTQTYVDAADGDLKVVFGDGTVKTIVTD